MLLFDSTDQIPFEIILPSASEDSIDTLAFEDSTVTNSTEDRHPSAQEHLFWVVPPHTLIDRTQMGMESERFS